MLKPFAQCSYREQIRRLTVAAHAALRKFPVRVRELKFINHGENTTFRVTDTRGRRYLLRVHRAGYHTGAALEEELRWLDFLARKKPVLYSVPRPIRSVHRAWHVRVVAPGLESPRDCDLLEWNTGRFVKNGLRPRHMFQLGRVIATLHKDSRGFTPRHRRYWTPEGMIGDRGKFAPFEFAVMTAAQRSVIRRYRHRLLRRLKRYAKSRNAFSMLHADLHFGNMLWQRSPFDGPRLALIDFDDSALGLRMYDLAVPAWWVMGWKRLKMPERRRYMDALMEGYDSVWPVTAADRRAVQDLILARELSMLGWIHHRADNPRLRPFLKKCLKKNLRAAREYRHNALLNQK